MAELKEKEFLEDVSCHRMSILRDEGLYKHLRFAQPGTNDMCFEIITWPGCLCYTGDMGTYVFQRRNDMLEFFRPNGRAVLAEGETLYVNSGYWESKLEAVDRFGGAREFCADNAIELIKKWFEDFCSSRKLLDDSKESLWDAIEEQVIPEIHTSSSGETLARAIMDFVLPESGECAIDAGLFPSVEELGCMIVPTRRFLWCCHAIAWGVKLYDERCESGGPGWPGLDTYQPVGGESGVVK